MSELIKGLPNSLYLGYMKDLKRVVIDLFYPRSGQLKEIEVGLSDVRAADSILISYDFERDGYVIKQASGILESSDVDTNHEDFQEVAFVKAWGRHKDPK